MKKSLELIIFDLDGTLYPVNPEMDRVYPRAAIQIIAEKSGTDIESAETEFLSKKAELAQILNGNPTSTLTLLYFYNVGFDEFEDKIDTLIDVKKYIGYDPKTTEIIDMINRQYQIFLYTTNNEKVSRRILKHLGLSRFFPKDRCFTYSDAGRLPLPKHEKLKYIKPEHKGFQYILEKHGTTADKVLMVGDSPISDIRPAEKLGLHTYHVKNRQDLYRLPAWLGIE